MVTISGFHRVDHRDIIEYLPVGRHDEVIFSSTIKAQLGPFSMLMLSVEGVHHKQYPSP